jgi:hypothetical protein
MNMTNDTANISSRTWNVTIPVYLEGAWLITLTHTVTAFRIGNQIIGALVDGAEATLERAANLLTWAKREGTLTVIETVEAAQPISIGKRVAYRLHIQLAGLGYGRGYGFASEVLGRDVTSLAALPREDAVEVLSAACGSVGVPTYGLAA